MAGNEHQQDPVNRHPNGTISISFALEDSRDGRIGKFPKGLDGQFTANRKETIIPIRGTAIIDGVSYSPGEAYTIDPPPGKTVEIRVQCPTSDVGYVCEYG